MSDNLTRVAALVRDLADLISRVAADRLGLPADEAAALGLDVAQTFCSEFGGQHVYVPLGFAVRIEQRDQDMYDEYIRSGRDIQAVVRAFNCSIHTAYRRIKLVEAAAYAARQPTLFDAPG